MQKNLVYTISLRHERGAPVLQLKPSFPNMTLTIIQVLQLVISTCGKVALTISVEHGVFALCNHNQVKTSCQYSHNHLKIACDICQSYQCAAVFQIQTRILSVLTSIILLGVDKSQIH